jgi:hypothetical protein
MDSDPDLKLSGLSIWVLDREFPNASDDWDSKWLRIRAVMEAPGARVSCEGSILMIDDFQRFRDEVEILRGRLEGGATLHSLEPNLKVSLQARSLGHVQVEVEITPDHMDQSHWFAFELDQSYLPSLIDGSDAVIGRFAVR